MQQIRNYGDQRALAWCVYCGGRTGMRDLELLKRYFENKTWNLQPAFDLD